MLHVSAGNPFRRWPADRFAALAAALTNLPEPMHVVITSGPSEAEAVDRVTRAARDTPSVEPSRIVHCGEFDLSELRALVSRARLYIGGDSGPLHIAATTRTPIVALFGPTLPERSLPWRDPAVPRSPWMPDRCRAGRAISARACPAIFAASATFPCRGAGGLPPAMERVKLVDLTTTLTVQRPAASPRDRVELVGVASLMGIAATMQFSIAVAEILLAVTVLCWLVLAPGRQARRIDAPSFFWPLVAYAAATLLSAGFSLDPAVSVVDCKQLLLFMLVPVVYDFARGTRADTVLSVIITVGAASAFVGIVQYAILNYDDLGRRPQGTLSHWMTYSGTLMLVICAAVARLLYGTRDRLWAAFVLPALIVSLALTLTRGAWVGAAAGIAVLFLIKDFRLTALIPVVVAAALLVAPDELSNRVNSIFDMNDPTSRDRVAMLEAGVAMVRDHP